MNNTISLRNYILNRRMYSHIKIHTFCHLMKKVSERISQEEKNIIKINLDDIKINISNGEVVLEEAQLANDLDKTMISINTGVSLMADRKTSPENKRVSFALMVLGWYVNPDESSVINDMTVLENFDLYMSLVPKWLVEYFIEIFKNMNYNLPFYEYYDTHFTKSIKKEVDMAFYEFDFSSNQQKQISNLIGKKSNELAKIELSKEVNYE